MAGSVVAVVANVSLAWWAGWEMVAGENPFRRALGTVVLASIAWRLLR